MHDRTIDFLTNAVNYATARQVHFNIGQEEGHDYDQTVEFLENLVKQGILRRAGGFYGAGYAINADESDGGLDG